MKPHSGGVPGGKVPPSAKVPPSVLGPGPSEVIPEPEGGHIGSTSPGAQVYVVDGVPASAGGPSLVSALPVVHCTARPIGTSIPWQSQSFGLSGAEQASPPMDAAIVQFRPDRIINKD